LSAGHQLTRSPDYRRISKFLSNRNFTGFTGKDLFIKNFIKKGWGQDIAALSNMAEALSFTVQASPELKEQIASLMEKVVDCALHKSVSPYSKPIAEVGSLGQFCYYLEHLNIILGHHHKVVGTKYRPLSQRISEHLLAETLSHHNLHARLLPRVKMRWSADQAAIIYSLWLHDENNATDFSAQLIEPWLKYMNEHRTHKSTGLFATEVMNAKRYSEEPRGCSSAYMIYYMSFFAPEAAKEQWELYKTHMSRNFIGLTAFREYLPGYKGGWTPDSGPIVFGLGVAASGLTLKTSAAMGDKETYDKLMRLVRPISSLCRVLGNAPLLGVLGSLGTDLLASSIRLAAQSHQQSRVMLQGAFWMSGKRG
jgi:hypothetical protein